MDALGIDISKYDKFFYPDLAVKPIDFVIQRAGHGVIKDEKFDELYDGVKKISIRGAYHYLYTGIYWKLQADAFLSIVSQKDFHFFAADFEEALNDLSVSFARDTYEWIKYVAQQTGKPVLLYTRKGLYDKYIAPSGKDWSVVDYWHAQWTSASEPNLPSGRTSWKVWQYGGESWGGYGTDYGLGSLRCDIDRFNGTVDDMKQWLNVSSTEPEIPDGTNGDEMVNKTYANGVVRKEWREYDSDIQAIIVPPSAIDSMTWKYMPTCVQVGSVDGDFVFNSSPFDTFDCKVNDGLRIDGVSYHNYVPYDPFVAFHNKKVYIEHPQKQYNNYPTVAQFWRYVIEHGAKGRTSSSWDRIDPCRLIGRLPDGSLVVVTAKGRDTNNRGINLHEAANIGLSLGCDMMVHGDSGESTNSYLKVNGEKQFFNGVPTPDVVAVVGVVKFLEPIIDETEPPPTDGEKLLQYDANGNLVRTWIPE